MDSPSNLTFIVLFRGHLHMTYPSLSIFSCWKSYVNDPLLHILIHQEIFCVEDSNGSDRYVTLYFKEIINS